MSQRTVGLIVAAIVVALTGLTVLQVSFLSTARKMEAESFRKSVFSALKSTVERLEAAEATSTAMSLAARPHDSLGLRIVTTSNDRPWQDSSGSEARLDIDMTAALPSVRWVNDTLVCVVPGPQKVILGQIDSYDQLSDLVLDTFLEAGEHRVPMAGKPGLDKGFIYRLEAEDSSGHFLKDVVIGDTSHLHNTIMIDLKTDTLLPASDSARFEFVQRVIGRLSIFEDLPMDKRINQHQIDSILHDLMNEAGIVLDFEYGIQVSDDTLPILISDSLYSRQLAGSDLRVGMFPQDLAGSPGELALFFPDREMFLWRQIWPLMAAATLLMGIIVLCFVYTIRTIIEQRLSGALIVDFVNNMTHEFKTPISTVALATEAILRKDVLGDQEKVAKFGRMIHSENKRMRQQAEKILQMAALEEKDHRLKLEPTDVHAVITEAVGNITLRLEARRGAVTCNLNAEEYNIMADPLHLSGIIYNLLDNADKYSPDNPSVSVRTGNIGHKLVITIADEGVGLKPDDQKRIFEKYYRVSTGNLHDVKGFGLGLSYVKLMVAEHGGEISVDSVVGKGTTIRLTFDSLLGEKEGTANGS